MKKLLTILMLIPVQLFGQNEPDTKIDLTKNNIYAEAHVGIISQLVMNYERQIYSGKKVSWYGRVGAGYGLFVHDAFYIDDGWGGLGTITMLTGKYNNHFEMNAGAFIGNKGEGIIINDGGYKVSSAFISPILNFGYRYQKPDGGFIFRVNAGIISLGLSFGYAF